ncbi:hypothetical protein FOZ63_025489, partial [Perkinsus olseni]
MSAKRDDLFYKEIPAGLAMHEEVPAVIADQLDTLHARGSLLCEEAESFQGGVADEADSAGCGTEGEQPSGGVYYGDQDVSSGEEKGRTTEQKPSVLPRQTLMAGCGLLWCLLTEIVEVTGYREEETSNRWCDLPISVLSCSPLLDSKINHLYRYWGIVADWSFFNRSIATSMGALFGFMLIVEPYIRERAGPVGPPVWLYPISKIACIIALASISYLFVAAWFQLELIPLLPYGAILACAAGLLQSVSNIERDNTALYKYMIAQRRQQMRAAGVTTTERKGSSPSRGFFAGHELYSDTRPPQTTTTTRDEFQRGHITVLRHKAVDMGISIDKAGYVRVQDLLAHPRFKSLRATQDDVQECVATNAKQRYMAPMAPSPKRMIISFALTTAPNGDLLIRATQGHSFPPTVVDPTLIMTPVDVPSLPPVLVHGTYFNHWKAILASGGLRPMSRQHIHLVDATATLTGIVSGLRKSAEIYIYIDAGKAAADHIAFFRSANNVYLTSGEDGLLGTQYFSKVVDVKKSAEVGTECLLDATSPPEKNTKEVALKKQLKAIQTKMYTSAREHDILGAFKTYEEIISNEEFVEAGLTKGMHARILTVAASDVNLEAGCPAKDIETARKILKLAQQVLDKCSQRQENILTGMVKLAVAAGEIDLALQYHKECLSNFQFRLRSYAPLMQLYSSPQYQDFDAAMKLVADLESRGFTLGEAELSYLLRCCPAGKSFDFLADKVANTIDAVTDSRLTDAIKTMGQRDSSVEVLPTEVSAEGACSATGIKLRSIDITDEELHELSDLTERLATQDLSEEQKQKFLDLKNYLDSQSTPATIIVDAANIGHMNQNYTDGFFQHSQIDDVAEHFTKEGKKVLVILHSKWLEQGLDLTV